MRALIERALSGFPNWSSKPIPNLSLSASGLVALADLSTIAQRTAITGGSSWMDILLLAPGLHYQQAADALAGTDATATEERSDHNGGGDAGHHASQGIAGPIGGAVQHSTLGGERTIDAKKILNVATINYLQRVSQPGMVVTLDVGTIPKSEKTFQGRTLVGRGATTIWAGDSREETVDLGWYSHLLYLMSPILTIIAMVFMILLQDWWGLSFILALIISRILNVWIIKQRGMAPRPPSSPPPKRRPWPIPMPDSPSDGHHRHKDPPPSHHHRPNPSYPPPPEYNPRPTPRPRPPPNTGDDPAHHHHPNPQQPNRPHFPPDDYDDEDPYDLPQQPDPYQPAPPHRHPQQPVPVPLPPQQQPYQPSHPSHPTPIPPAPYKPRYSGNDYDQHGHRLPALDPRRDATRYGDDYFEERRRERRRRSDSASRNAAAAAVVMTTAAGGERETGAVRGRRGSASYGAAPGAGALREQYAQLNLRGGAGPEEYGEGNENDYYEDYDARRARPTRRAAAAAAVADDGAYEAVSGTAGATPPAKKKLPRGGARVTVRPADPSPWRGRRSSHERSRSRSGSVPRLTSYLVELGDGACVRLQGMSNDLRAITQSVWLKEKTHFQGYLEAMAKLIVYLVASFSGNLKQSGSIVLMALLLISAALLGLSNAHAKTFKMRGRVATPRGDEGEPGGGTWGSGGKGGTGYSGGKGGGYGRGTGTDGGAAGGGGGGRGGEAGRRRPGRRAPYPAEGEGDVKFPGTSYSGSSGLSAMDDWAEKGQVGGHVRDSYPFHDGVDYN